MINEWVGRWNDPTDAETEESSDSEPDNQANDETSDVHSVYTQEHLDLFTSVARSSGLPTASGFEDNILFKGRTIFPSTLLGTLGPWLLYCDGNASRCLQFSATGTLYLILENIVSNSCLAFTTECPWLIYPSS